MYYNPQTISHLNALTVITDAYRAAGKQSPTIADGVETLLDAEPDEDQVVNDFTRAAVAGQHDPEQLLDTTVAAVQRARAVATIRDHFHRVKSIVVAEDLDQLRDAAVKAVTPAFKRTVKTLTDALAQLDPDRPLDRDRAFDTDTTAQWKQATGALATLGAYAFTTTHTTHHAWAGTRLLPILSIPDTTPERGTGSRFAPWEPEPGQPGTKERNAIRQLLRDADRDTDTALVRVAQGRYHGLVTFALADTTELERRRLAYETAHARVNTNRNPALVRLPA